jgi:hypothetical protein
MEEDNCNIDEYSSGEESVIIDTDLRYVLLDGEEKELESEEGSARLYSDRIKLVCRYGDALTVHLREIKDFKFGSYKILLELKSSERLVLCELGYEYENFSRELRNSYTGILLEDMLVTERKLLKVQGELIYSTAAGEEIYKGECEVYVYTSYLVIINHCTKPMKIPYSIIADFEEENYSVTVVLDNGFMLRFYRLGEAIDNFKKAIYGATSKMQIKVQRSLKELLPQLSSISLRNLAGLMKDGKAVSSIKLKAISYDLWVSFEKKLKSRGCSEEYDYLKALSKVDNICIGYKKGLLHNMTEAYFWFLIPIYGANKALYGNTIAMEAISREGRGRATYFFRIMGRAEYKACSDINILNKAVEDFIKVLNFCMLYIDFRREPIYLSDKALDKCENIKYKNALSLLPELELLRKHFIGRVMHTSFERWTSGVNSLLLFNISEASDDKKWSKRAEDSK